MDGLSFFIFPSLEQRLRLSLSSVCVRVRLFFWDHFALKVWFLSNFGLLTLRSRSISGTGLTLEVRDRMGERTNQGRLAAEN